MAIDNIELIDRDYEKCSKVAMPRQIKTRKGSFSSIFSKFNEFRRKYYEKKLDKVVDKTLSDTYTDENIFDKLTKRSKLIAELEKKIKVLSYENVPSKYVKRRAIKLRNHMMSNAVKNSDNIYTIEIGKGSSENIAEPTNDIEVSLDNINRDSIEQAINDGFNKIELESEKVDTPTEFINVPTTFVSPEEVNEVVNSSSQIELASEESVVKEDTVSNDEASVALDDIVPDVPIETHADESVEIGDIFKSDVASEAPVAEETPIPIVDETPVVEENKEDNDDLEINIENIKEEVGNAINAINESKVSHSEVSVAKTDKYDENGNVRYKNTYSPMTDEEIAASQDKINSLKDYEEETEEKKPVSIIDNNLQFTDIFAPVSEKVFNIDTNPIKGNERDVPIVVTPRDESQEDVIDNDVVFDDDSDKIEFEEFKFDDKPNEEKKSYSDDNGSISIIDSDEKALVSVEDKKDTRRDTASRLEEFNMLKSRVLDLKKRRSEASKNMHIAQTTAVEVAKKAAEAKAKADESQEYLNNRVEELRSYCEGLEKNCDETAKETSLIENDIQMNNNFIEFQNGKFDENTRLIDEINSLIGEENYSNSRVK